LLAASGGGTRAALFTTSVLHGLARNGQIDRVVLASGVSGGSAALAYFAIHKDELKRDDKKSWEDMNNALSSAFIDNVLAGAAELRITLNTRLGQLLTESFQREFLNETDSKKENERVTLGAIDDIGLIFNTSLCGTQDPQIVPGYATEMTKNVGRLVITNVVSDFDRDSIPSGFSWEPDLPYKVIKDPDASIFSAASLSANFPPVFSNASVKAGEETYWVTDGGAVENRGAISILLVLKESLGKILERKSDYLKDKKLNNICIIVADAGAFEPDYKSDRGLGAKMGASSKIANGWIRALVEEINELHYAISEKKNGVQIIYLPMPDVLRASQSFGTHWRMPNEIQVKNALTEKNGVPLSKDEIIDLIDSLFRTDYDIYMKKTWPDLKPDIFMTETSKQWNRVKECLGILGE
jgi:hypothetical protein